MSIIRPLDVESLADQFRSAEPFRFVQIDDALDPDFAASVASAYSAFESARADGRLLESVNEHLKVQVTDREHFPEPVQRLSDALSSREFFDQLSAITGIKDLIADPALSGGGMHQTGPRGRLDVHVDFNRLEPSGWHRRLNLLIYLNPEWHREWGGNIELWDKRVRVCHHSFQPILNRCVIFQTSEVSFHGVEPVTYPGGVTRRSFAAYYYTVEAPEGGDGATHSTVFRARPSEPTKRLITMPAQQMMIRPNGFYRHLKDTAKRLLGL